MVPDQPTNPRKAQIKATASQRRKGLILFLFIAVGLGSVTVMETVGFDVGHLFYPCGFKQRYHLPCPTCGYTTALRAYASGHIGRAFYTQPGAAFICLLLTFIALMGLFVAVSGLYPRWIVRTLSFLTLKRTFWLLMLIVLAGWMVTLTRGWRFNHM